MVEMVIERFQTRYRLPRDRDGAVARRARIEGPLAAMANEHLEVALARLSLGDDLVLVRDLVAPIRLKRGETAWQAALAWSEAIASALEDRLRDGGGPGVVRFRRRSDAVEAMVRRALQGDDREDWAWRQLGFLDRASEGSVSAAERIASAATAIAADPARAAVILLRLAETGWLAALARELDALAAVELAVAVAEGSAFVATPRAAGTLDPAAEPAMAQYALGRAFVVAIRAAPEAARRAWAQLAATILEAPRLAAGRAGLQILIVRWLRAAERGAERRSPSRPDGWRRRPTPDVSADEAYRDARAAELPAAPVTADPSVAEGVVLNDADPGSAVEREPAWTAFGGLMLLLPLVAESGAGEALFDVDEDAILRARLHALALALGGEAVQPGDPAVLAFAGLAPWAKLPAEADAPELITQARETLLVHLRERLPSWRDAGDLDLLARIAARPAHIAFEPGWIEVRFDLDAIDPDIRRAGIDLDPDFLPWLGLVLKYRYV